ncbi:Smr/MutS family protein [Sedimentitalea sp. XS_ASV28]|uniref:Smr/MutS family protein n=1 Tax=Sedimentitalea sp. XS_ASV28 TaxID=3241296 RepID=UPI0035195D67
MVRRRLTDEEIDLWHRVAERTERLHPDGAPARPLPKPKPNRNLASTDPSQVPRPSPATPPSPTLSLRPPSVQMDRKAYTRMKRGKLAPEGRIDLHGMTLDRAHPVLNRFILSSQASGRRLVLVITGKGKVARDNGPIPVPRGILRRNVPLWLSMPPLAQAVLQVESAHISHGGDGAFYVYLRRAR